MTGINKHSHPTLLVQPAAKLPFSVRLPFPIFKCPFGRRGKGKEKKTPPLNSFPQSSRSSRWYHRSCSCRDAYGSDQNPTPSPTPQHGRPSRHSQIPQRRPRPIHGDQGRRPVNPLPRRLPHRSPPRNQPSRKLHGILLPQILHPTPPRKPILRVTFLPDHAYWPRLRCHGSIE